MSEQKELKPLPVLRSDEDAERFVDEADLTDYDLSGFRRVRFSWACKHMQAACRPRRR